MYLCHWQARCGPQSHYSFRRRAFDHKPRTKQPSQRRRIVFSLRIAWFVGVGISRAGVGFSLVASLIASLVWSLVRFFRSAATLTTTTLTTTLIIGRRTTFAFFL